MQQISTISIYQLHRLCAELCGWYISHFPSFLYISLLTYLLPAAAAASAAASATRQLYCLIDSFIVTFFPFALFCVLFCLIAGIGVCMLQGPRAQWQPSQEGPAHQQTSHPLQISQQEQGEAPQPAPTCLPRHGVWGVPQELQ